jgi:hypothetical protein
VETMGSFWYFGGNHGPPTEKIHRGLIFIFIFRWVDFDFDFRSVDFDFHFRWV